MATNYKLDDPTLTAGSNLKYKFADLGNGNVDVVDAETGSTAFTTDKTRAQQSGFTGDMSNAPQLSTDERAFIANQPAPAVSDVKDPANPTNFVSRNAQTGQAVYPDGIVKTASDAPQKPKVKGKSSTKAPKANASSGLTGSQLTQYNQLLAAGASEESALNAARLVQEGGQTTSGGQAIKPTGSVVDTLKMAGQDSSFAARQQLALQYGIQSYQGTAAQNIELEKKFTEAYNQLKGGGSPQSPAEARNALSSYFEEEKNTTDPTKQFMDTYSSMNPMEAQIFDQMSQLLDSKQNQQSLREIYEQEVADQGIEGLNIELADLNRIMEGTDDDIRSEITAAGGFATESQVQAMAGARNKVLLRKAQYLSDVISSKNDYVSNIMALTEADRKQVSEDLDRKLGITQMLYTMTNNMQNRAQENMQNLVEAVGYEGLIALAKGNPSAESQIESTLGLPYGALSDPDFLSLVNSNREVDTEVVEAGGHKLLIDSKTGQTIKDLGSAGDGGAGALTTAQMNATVNQIVGAFDNEPIVKQYNVLNEGYQFANSLSNTTTNPADDQGLIYAFAKAMDPNSVVREGEYATVQKYAQSWVKAYGSSINQAINGTGFLSESARKSIKDTIGTKYEASLGNYQNVYNQYQQRIDGVKGGGYNSLTDYDKAYSTGGSTSVFADIEPYITFNGTNAYIPRSVWASVTNKDGLLQEAQNDGYSLLIND